MVVGDSGGVAMVVGRISQRAFSFPLCMVTPQAELTFLSCLPFSRICP